RSRASAVLIREFRRTPMQPLAARPTPAPPLFAGRCGIQIGAVRRVRDAGLLDLGLEHFALAIHQRREAERSARQDGGENVALRALVEDGLVIVLRLRAQAAAG